jgi:hypothetical protein
MKTLNTYFNLISIGGVLNILISKNNFIVLYYFFLVNFSQYFEKCEKNCSVEFLIMPNASWIECWNIPSRCPPRPKLHPILLTVSVTLLYSTSSVPVGNR